MDGPSGDARSYLYDPHRPIPTLGGRNMLIDSGPRDQRPVHALPNYGLIYQSEVLDEDLTIAGAVHVTLHIQSNCRDTDFVAKVIERQPDGCALLLMDGVVRAMYRNAEAGPQVPQHLAPEQISQVTIHLGDIYHTFPAGSRLQVDITSSNFPRRARNTNSGNTVLANDTAADIHIATNVVHHSKERPSYLVLPQKN
jgi:putative CocE/NonD family hydrolase